MDKVYPPDDCSGSRSSCDVSGHPATGIGPVTGSVPLTLPGQDEQGPYLFLWSRLCYQIQDFDGSERMTAYAEITGS